MTLLSNIKFWLEDFFLLCVLLRNSNLILKILHFPSGFLNKVKCSIWNYIIDRTLTGARDSEICAASFHSISARCRDCCCLQEFLVVHSSLRWFAWVGTGKSFSEVHILALINPQYDKRLSIEFTSSEHENSKLRT